MANKKRLIDANALAHKFLLMPGHYRKAEIDLIDSAPTVDAVEVVHGQWIQDGELDEDGNGQYHCSVCWAGEKHNPIVDVPYCWKCGAKMDGGNEDV